VVLTIEVKMRMSSSTCAKQLATSTSARLDCCNSSSQYLVSLASLDAMAIRKEILSTLAGGRLFDIGADTGPAAQELLRDDVFVLLM
jgi:hypothetical protein